MGSQASSATKMHEVRNDPKIGKVVRELRERMGWSIRDLAKASGLNKNTILHVEKGLSTKLAVLEQIGDALGAAPPRLAYLANLSNRRWQVHKKKGGQWAMLRGTRDLKNPEMYRELVQEIAERKRLGQLGFASSFVKPLECVLKDGRLLSGLAEIYGRLEVKRSPGETFVYCLRGSLQVEVGEEKFVLEEGEATTILDKGDTVYSPSPGTPPQELPITFVYVRLSADERVTAAQTHPASEDPGK